MKLGPGRSVGLNIVLQTLLDRGRNHLGLSQSMTMASHQRHTLSWTTLHQSMLFWAASPQLQTCSVLEWSPIQFSPGNHCFKTTELGVSSREMLQTFGPCLPQDFKRYLQT